MRPQARKMNPDYKKIAAFVTASLDREYLQDATGLHIRTDAEAFQALKTCYHSEYWCTAHQARNYQRTFADWLQGVPSALSIPFYNHDILTHAVEWNSLPEDATEAEEGKILEGYWIFMAMQYGKAARKHGIELFTPTKGPTKCQE